MNRITVASLPTPQPRDAMAEHKWLAATDPQAMLAFLTSIADEVKLRRYCVEAVRPFADLFFHPTSGAALAIAEEVAEGRGSEQELITAGLDAWAAFPFRGFRTTDEQITAAMSAARAAEPVAHTAAVVTSRFVPGISGLREQGRWAKENQRRTFLEFQLQAWRDEDDQPTLKQEEREAHDRGEAVGKAVLANLLRDIFGNPFRPVVADPSWLTETAVGIAQGIYDDRAFERLPILADALEEAGCDSAELLAHCREPGTHVRGCWAVDLVLGKS